MVEIPRSLRAIDAGWLTDALREAGHDSPAVETVAFEPMSGVVGGIGEVGVLSITYGGATTLPPKMVGKCPLDHGSARQYDKILQFYRRERSIVEQAGHGPQCVEKRVTLH